MNHLKKIDMQRNIKIKLKKIKLYKNQNQMKKKKSEFFINNYNAPIIRYNPNIKNTNKISISIQK